MGALFSCCCGDANTASHRTMNQTRKKRGRRSDDGDEGRRGLTADTEVHEGADADALRRTPTRLQKLEEAKAVDEIKRAFEEPQSPISSPPVSLFQTEAEEQKRREIQKLLSSLTSDAEGPSASLNSLASTMRKAKDRQSNTTASAESPPTPHL